MLSMWGLHHYILPRNPFAHMSMEFVPTWHSSRAQYVRASARTSEMESIESFKKRQAVINLPVDTGANKFCWRCLFLLQISFLVAAIRSLFVPLQVYLARFYKMYRVSQTEWSIKNLLQIFVVCKFRFLYRLCHE